MNECCKKTKVRNEEDKKQIICHLNRIKGQIEGITNMVNEDRYCDDIITQLKAVSKSTDSLANKLLENHMKTCMVEDIKNGNLETIDEVLKLIRRN